MTKEIVFFVAALWVPAAWGAAWKYEITKEQFTDKKTGSAYTASISTSKWGKRAVLFIRCTDTADFDLFVDWGEYLAGTRPPVTIRIDKNRELNVTTKPSTDKTATFFKDSDLLDIVDQMISGSKMLAFATDYQGTRTPIAQFSLIGFTKSLNAACGWHPKAPTRENIARKKRESYEAPEKKYEKLRSHYKEYTCYGDASCQELLDECTAESQPHDVQKLHDCMTEKLSP